MQSQKETPPAQPVAQPAQAPFTSYIGGAGIIEARTQNISIGTSLPGIVKTVFVNVGDKVKAGAPLFQIDDRELRAELLVKQANLVKARAAVAEARASLKDYQAQYELVRHATDRRAVSVDDVQKRRYAEELARAKLASAGAAVTAAEADLKATRTSLERLTVRAPIDCEVMQVNVRPGEYAQTGVLSTPLIRLGDLDRLHIRVDIDENDAWRFKPETRAVASLRGNRDLKTDLIFRAGGAVRDPEDLPYRQQHRASRHQGAAGHLQLRPEHPACLRRTADGRLYRDARSTGLRRRRGSRGRAGR